MLSEQSIRDLLADVASGRRAIDEALVALRALPYEDIGFARVDHHRGLRQGFAEVVYCSGKTPQQAAQIIARLAEHHGRVLGTRATPEQFQAAAALVPDLEYHDLARAVSLDRRPRPRRSGVVLVSAGTADLPVAEEARLTLELMGHEPRRIYDIGVAGLHRLLGEVGPLQSANVVIVVAGMEGALPSVVGGLVGGPVIAVPTSTGYGASFGGLAALLGMLNSCAAGVAVVNIDNGFGAGCLAARINHLACEGSQQQNHDPKDAK